MADLNLRFTLWEGDPAVSNLGRAYYWHDGNRGQFDRRSDGKRSDQRS